MRKINSFVNKYVYYSVILCFFPKRTKNKRYYSRMENKIL